MSGSRIIKLLVFIVLTSFAYRASSQNLINSRRSGYNTYIFRISDKEAGKIYSKSRIKWTGREHYFHDLIDSFPLYSEYNKKLAPGHYLKVSVRDNEIEASIASVLNVSAQIVTNNTDLCVQLFDSCGIIIKDAEATIGSKHLRFDNSVNGFLLKKANRKGILRVRYKGTVNYFNIDRTRNNSFARRAESAILLGTPLKYIWVPVKFVVSIPLFVVKESVHGEMYSFGRDFVYFCRRFGFGGWSYRGDRYKGYFVFNKPKYLPGDTVWFKSYAVTKHGKPVQKELSLRLYRSSGKKVDLGKIRPVIPGNYNGHFVLADSLGLDLDSSHELTLVKGKWKTAASGRFRYEDYELKNITLAVTTDDDKQIRGREYRVHIRATDENDLNILDGRIELTLKSLQMHNQYKKDIFVKDTLLTRKMKLEQMGETVVTIPDSIFPRADLLYSINVRVIRTDNNFRAFDKKIEYLDHLTELTYELKGDSILFMAKRNGKDSTCKAQISGTDRYEISSVRKIVILPFVERIDPFLESYKVTTGDISKTFNITEDQSSVRCESRMLNDTLSVSIINPRNLPVTWFMYKANHLESKGYGTRFEYREKASQGVRYFLSLSYLWAGFTRNETFDLSGSENELNINVEQPSLVYPGQKVKIGIRVTDNNGVPVEGADLTAFSFTKKFNDYSPRIYSFPDTRKSKKLINTFGVREEKRNLPVSKKLDYDLWKKIFSLDTIEYYNFLYHRKEIYFYSYRPIDGITQFSPYVVKKGDLKEIQVISIDRVPVYFAWAGNNENPYSFRVDSGYHFVELRTADRIFKIDSVYFRYGMKLIMSVNDIENPPGIKAYDAKPYFSDYEKSSMGRYLFPFRNNFGREYAYLKQGDKITLLNSPDNPEYFSNYAYGAKYTAAKAVGPVYPGSTILNLPGSYSHTFDNEPDFEYEFFPLVIKMRSTDKHEYMSYNLFGSANLLLTDIPLSEKRIKDAYDELVFKRKLASAKFLNPSATLPRYGKLTLNIDSLSAGFGPLPIFIVLMNGNNHFTARVCTGSSTVIENLDQGVYSISLIYRGDKYFRYDSVPVRPDGRNFTHLPRPGNPVHDSLSIELSHIIDSKAYGSYSEPDHEFENYLKQLQTQTSLTKFYGEGRLVSGSVKADNEALPGVTVVVKGTTIGTATDINGNYSFFVPIDSKELLFSYIGFKNAEIPISNEFAEVTLTEEVLALQEVVVVGYGVSRKSNLTASTVTASLSGRVSGINVGVSGNSTISIRGASSINASNAPLFIIDGVPYTGDLSDLDPSMLTNITVLKDESMSSLYGARAANGVVVISTAGMNLKNSKIKSFLKGAVYSDAFMQEVASASSIRSNFRDYAYWKPELITDKDGRASFEARFPDDVTSWQTFVLAMNGKKQSCQTSGSIKSFKPLMAQLFTPRFLIEGDSTNLIGKILNYTPDTVSLTLSMEINGKSTVNRKASCANSINDTLSLKANSSDTISAKYFFRKADGYLDGEERKIPVFRKGLEMTKGSFFVLNGDSTVNVKNDKDLGEGRLYAQADMLSVVDDEIDYLNGYSYECNEQMASKLIALLARENICKFRGTSFLKKNLVNKLIHRLGENQNSDGCWGWWDRSETSVWVTVHVMSALTSARSMGYATSLNNKFLNDYVIWKLESGATNQLKMDLLYLMSFTDEKIDYAKYISKINEGSLKSLDSRFRLIELKQRRGFEYSIDSVLKYENKTLFGNIWFGKPSDDRSVDINEVQATLTAYRILKGDKSTASDYLERIRNYLFERRRLGRWDNTFESASIIQTILPEILKDSKGDIKKPNLIISGSVSKTVTEFPFEIKTGPADSINISKTGTFPVYLTSYQHYWKVDPAADTASFTIETRFEGNDKIVTAGKPVKMKISLRVHKDAQYVMLEVPIPAGCSYESKDGYYHGSSHSEFFKDHVAVFYSNLNTGRYDFEIDLLPRFTGKYTLNPAKAELMYFPVFSSNNALKQLIIK